MQQAGPNTEEPAGIGTSSSNLNWIRKSCCFINVPSSGREARSSQAQQNRGASRARSHARAAQEMGASHCFINVTRCAWRGLTSLPFTNLLRTSRWPTVSGSSGRHGSGHSKTTIFSWLIRRCESVLRHGGNTGSWHTAHPLSDLVE
jgi:hypothetical protein